MKNKVGFTLIELLAIIAILGVLAIFLVPKLINTLNDTKKKSFISEVKTIYKAAEDSILLSYIGNDIPSEFNSVNAKLDVDSKLKYIVSIIDEKVDSICVSNGEYSLNIEEFNTSADIKIESIETGDLCGNVESAILANQSCFSVVGNAIKTYYNYEGNNSSNPACPRALEIPSVINGNTITTLDTTAFYNKQITKVTLPSTITSINAYALAGNSLTSVILPQGLTYLGAGALYNNQLRSITIPSGITSIYMFTFNKNKLQSITIPSGVTYIGSLAFEENELEAVSLPNSLTTIENYAFQDNHLKNLVIPSSVTYIGTSVFNNNDLPDSQAFIYKRTDTNSDGVAEIDSSYIISYGGLKKVDISIPDGVVKLDEYSFAGSGIISVNIPSSVTSIYKAAFNDNDMADSQAFIYKRTDVNSDGVAEIDSSHIVSYGGAKRENIVIPGTAFVIGESAFEDLQIKSVSIESGVTEILYSAFSSNLLTTIKIPSSIEKLGSWAFESNPLTNVCIVGKNSSADFELFGEDGYSVFSWASGYSESNITWNCTN